MTKKQIETLIFDAQIAVRTHANNTDKIMQHLKSIETFLKTAYELHIIDSYNEVIRIQKQVGQAAMAELEKVMKEIA